LETIDTRKESEDGQVGEFKVEVVWEGRRGELMNTWDGQRE